MSRPTSEPPQVSYFKGTGWPELESFIHDMRFVGWKEGKLQDQLWMANHASLYLSGKALRWHAKLPQDIQESWHKLQVAMVERWSPPDDFDDDGGFPAAAPPETVSSVVSGPPPTLAVVKVLRDKSNVCLYLAKPNSERGSGSYVLTTDITKAVRIRRSPVSGPYDLETVESDGDRGYGWLAVHWGVKSSSLGVSSNDWARISVIDSITRRSSYNSDTPFQTGVWGAVPGGELNPTWIESSQPIHLSAFVHLEQFVCLSPNKESYQKRYPKESEARLFLVDI